MNKTQEKTLSVIIPAFNEEGNIRHSIESVLIAVNNLVADFEIIVINDGSRDETEKIALVKSQANSSIRVVSNDSNKGFGFSFARGVSLARMNYVTVFPGDNDMSHQSLEQLIDAMGSADIVTSHVINMQKRSILRRALSRGFVMMMNFLFGLHLDYYNGAFVARTELVRSIPIKSMGLTALAECLVRLIKAGYSYKSIPFEHTGRKSEKSKALRLKSFFAVLQLVFILWKDIHFLKPTVQQKPVCSI